MSKERRKHHRIPKLIDAKWVGGRAGLDYRVGDLSLGGCFIHCLSTPNLGETTTIAVTAHDGEPLTLTGVVVHVEARIGFSVEFQPLPADDAARLSAFLEYLQNA